MDSKITTIRIRRLAPAFLVMSLLLFVVLTPLGLGQSDDPYPFATLKPAAP